MASLFRPPKPTKHRLLPEPRRRAILELRAEHAALNARAIARICNTRFGRSIGHHAVKRVLAAGPLPTIPLRCFPPYHQVPDSVRCRVAIIWLHSEGWYAKSIAQYL